MDNDLFEELIKIGIDKTTAHKVAASLNPDHIATKEDILRMEKLIMDTRLSSKKDILRLEQTVNKVQRQMKEEMAALQMESTKKFADMQSKNSEQFMLHNRQFTITFLGMILTACVLFTLNLYFH